MRDKLGRFIKGNKPINKTHFKKGNQINKGRKPTNAFKLGNIPWNKKSWQKFRCKKCNQIYSRPQWILNQNKGRTYFCSMKCKNLYWKERFSGHNNPAWVGGKMTYRGRNWIIQREKIVKRCKGFCERCHKFIGNSIAVHHKIPFRNKKINCLSNLIALCQSCHMKVEPRQSPCIRQMPSWLKLIISSIASTTSAIPPPASMQPAPYRRNIDRQRRRRHRG